MTTRLVSAAKTDVGLKRTDNEDNFIMVPSQGLYVLADGMGGHASGKMASTLCVTHISQYVCETSKQQGFEFRYTANPSLSYEANLLVDAIKYANERVYIQSCKDSAMEGMGTTVTAIYSVPQGLVLAHVGDSRIYRIRDKQIVQMSRDHSLLNHLIDTGEIKAEDADRFANKNVILRAIGLKDYVDVEAREVRREQGDIYLMCSDGLSDLVTEQQILQAVCGAANLSEACGVLIGMALQAGGKDNVTVVCVCVEVEDGVVVHKAGAQPLPASPQPAGQAAQSLSQSGGLPSMLPPVSPASMPMNRMSMPQAPSMPATSRPLRMHSVREVVVSETSQLRVKRQMPKPVGLAPRNSAASMPAIPAPVSNKTVAPLSSDDVFDADEHEETRVQSREQVLRSMAAHAATVQAAPKAESGSKTLRKIGDLAEEKAPPSAALLMTSPPQSMDEGTEQLSAALVDELCKEFASSSVDDHRTVMECPLVTDEMLVNSEGVSAESSGLGASSPGSGRGEGTARAASVPLPPRILPPGLRGVAAPTKPGTPAPNPFGVRPASIQPAQPASAIEPPKAVPAISTPSPVYAPPVPEPSASGGSVHDDDDDDSIEIDASLFNSLGDDVTRQFFRPPFKR